MSKEKIGITMIRLYCDMLDSRAEALIAKAKLEDEKVTKAEVGKMIDKKGLTKAYNELVTVEQGIKNFETRKCRLENEILKGFNTSYRYGSWEDKLSSIAGDRITLPSAILKAKLEGIKDAIKLSDSTDAVREIFDNLDKYLK